jgi:hypothetical protein
MILLSFHVKVAWRNSELMSYSFAEPPISPETIEQRQLFVQHYLPMESEQKDVPLHFEVR